MSIKVTFNKRVLSRERVISISFVDILIQTIFLLLLLLFVGYLDPLEKLKIQSEVSAGRDYCNKKYPNNPIACKQDLDNQAKNLASLSNLSPCLSTTKVAVNTSIILKIANENEFYFEKFTPEYNKYLAEKNDSVRLAKANEFRSGLVIPVSDISSKIGFMREDNCYHVASMPHLSEDSQLSGPATDKLRNRVSAVLRHVSR
jgi:hypothetical protein